MVLPSLHCLIYNCIDLFFNEVLDLFTNILSVFVLFAADRIFKIAAIKYFSDRPIVLIPGFIGINVLEGGNPGAAFGILSDKTELLAALSAIVSLVLLVILIINRFDAEVERWGYVLLCAGALGNLYDRIVNKSVTDYLEFLFVKFPVFNLADILVDIGCLLLFIGLFFPAKNKLSSECDNEDFYENDIQ